MLGSCEAFYSGGKPLTPACQFIQPKPSTTEINSLRECRINLGKRDRISATCIRLTEGAEKCCIPLKYLLPFVALQISCLEAGLDGALQFDVWSPEPGQPAADSMGRDHDHIAVLHRSNGPCLHCIRCDTDGHSSMAVVSRQGERPLISSQTPPVRSLADDSIRSSTAPKAMAVHRGSPSSTLTPCVSQLCNISRSLMSFSSWT